MNPKLVYEQDGFYHDYEKCQVGTLQQKMLYVKYERTLAKYRSAVAEKNAPMEQIYERDLKIIKMTISILGIHIDGINR